MREIIFRGKRVDNGEWVEGCLSLYSEPGKVEIMYPCLTEDDHGHIMQDYDFVEVDPDTVGQFTGQIDKHTNRIFEGDILMYDCSKAAYSVEWYDDSCGFEPLSDSVNNCGHCGGGMMTDWCEVIGNIHDNPEIKLSRW